MLTCDTRWITIARSDLKEQLKARTLQRVKRSTGKEVPRNKDELIECLLFFGIKPTSIVWSVHSAFQHSDGSGGDSPIVREATLDPSGLVRFEQHQTLTPSGPSNRSTLKERTTPNPYTERSFKQAHAQRTPDTKSFEEGW